MSEEEREQLYCMIGGDGKEYGPATADQIRRWIAEGRANAYTPARLAGDEGPEAWRPLGERPEFAEALRAAGEAPAPEPPPLEGAARFGGEPTVPSAPPEAPPRELTVGGALAGGWGLWMSRFGLITAACWVAWLIPMALMPLSIAGPVLQLLVKGPLAAGAFWVTLKVLRGRETTLGDMFEGLSHRWLHLVVISVAIDLLSQLGYVFCVLPGLALRMMWIFALLLAIDQGLPPAGALAGSWRMAAGAWGKLALILTAAHLPTLIFGGYVLLRMTDYTTGLLGPMGEWTGEALRNHMPEIVKLAAKLELQSAVVWLLNMPFAFAVVTWTYETFRGENRPSA